MWVTTAEAVEMDVSPSLLPGNLSRAGDYVAFASMEDVVVFNTTTNAKPNKVSLVEKTVVYQALVCAFEREQLLVIANESGCQIWDLLGEHLYFSLALTKEPPSGSEGEYHFCRGICAETTTKSILVGSSLGKLYMLSQTAAGEAKGRDHSEFHLQSTVKGHNAAVQAVATNGSAKEPLAVSSDDDGTLIVWGVEPSGLEKKQVIQGTSFPTTSLRCFQTRWVLTGDTTGKLRLVDMHDGVISADVGAHSRHLSALDVHNDRVATVGEDGYLHVWKLKDDAGATGLRFELEHSHRAGDDLMTGVAFASSTKILTTSYDSTLIKAWVDAA
ncbi:hypothetical protein SDRG_14634 [Saprolegnia diclina VS20]|uniref:WD repeat-containing protein 54 beta-propeller domain-containing protein n=1 Tax=Saprolegnia diclina (strain VS20) TaxID=1156394 RepID=T0Q2G5_SAPDV|nr:hypothetical protein SDRG_14634 [Saprolegnia diclina VS20]EQC27580.1 hypothetical protein SDRG_14634 [Saprolegnia diclina VS20]|eukprot:XP_008619000.1 hypothetical protein SDRG_14634 [Saprolegnia diclina VS20]